MGASADFLPLFVLGPVSHDWGLKLAASCICMALHLNRPTEQTDVGSTYNRIHAKVSRVISHACPWLNAMLNGVKWMNLMHADITFGVSILTKGACLDFYLVCFATTIRNYAFYAAFNQTCNSCTEYPIYHSSIALLPSQAATRVCKLLPSEIICGHDIRHKR